VIFWLLPAYVCDDEECACMWARFRWLTWLLYQLPFLGLFLVYHRGGYCRRLWAHLTGGDRE